MSKGLFVTGKLAAKSLKETLSHLPADFTYQVAVLNISVAALMNTDFLMKNLPTGDDYTEIVLPGLCRADTQALSELLGIPVKLGPKDLKDLPAFCGQDRSAGERESETVPPRPQIIAEIVDAPYFSTPEILARATYYRNSGADIIDIGCCVEREFPHLEETIFQLKEAGFQVSLDSFNEQEIQRAAQVGIDLLLSLNNTNIHLAPHLSCPAVIIPDFGQGLESLERNVSMAHSAGVTCIIDPILDPLTYGFTTSVNRYLEARKLFPTLPFMMGIGNVTELTDADSTGLNALLIGIACELGIDYVLTTEASARTRGAIREAVAARWLMALAQKKGSPPKNLSDDLIALKDRRVESYSTHELMEMQQQVTDGNYRIFTSGGQIFVFNCKHFLFGSNAQDVFSQLNIADPSHAFYLGRELYKAQLSLQLGKKYIQEEELHWGVIGGERGRKNGEIHIGD